ncbi:MAG: type II toxin-antitoxin system YafQ family toxin [Candidatus Kapabacteria bacterium]|jgi:addiction module RelE/StbE family toxin|nr:type II toxin-antitoxin system YafQ family toxin [Candidatus Kapabacteria bacterium]
MRIIRSTKHFEKSYQAFLRRNNNLKVSVDRALELLREDTFSPKLHVHHLKGTLHGFQACSCGYDCRIVFRIERDEATNQEYILLVDIGTHDEVY